MVYFTVPSALQILQHQMTVWLTN